MIHYPALIKLLESFCEFTGNRWTHAGVLEDLAAVAEYERAGSLDKLKLVSRSLSYNRGKLHNEADAKNVSTVLLVHNIALTYWAASTVLSRLAGDQRKFRIYGNILDEKSLDLSKIERDLLLKIYRTCHGVQFIDELRTSNFASMWDDTSLDSDSVTNRTK